MWPGLELVNCPHLPLYFSITRSLNEFLFNIMFVKFNDVDNLSRQIVRGNFICLQLQSKTTTAK